MTDSSSALPANERDDGDNKEDDEADTPPAPDAEPELDEPPLGDMATWPD